MTRLGVAQGVFLEKEGSEWRLEFGAGFWKAWEGNWKWQERASFRKPLPQASPNPIV